MSGIVLALVGLALGFLGTLSVRLGIGLAGFGGAWLLADALNASPGVTALVAAAGAIVALVLSAMLARFMFFVCGVCLGAIVGAKIFVLVNGGGQDWLLAIIVVAAVGLIGGFIAGRWRRGFLRWATAVAGAGLVLSGLGRIAPHLFGMLWRPQTAVGTVILIAAWVVLSVLGHRVQLVIGHHRKGGGDNDRSHADVKS